MATVMSIDPVIAIECSGYKKYGSNIRCKSVCKSNRFRQLSTMEQKRYVLSIMANAISSKLNEFRIDFPAKIYALSALPEIKHDIL